MGPDDAKPPDDDEIEWDDWNQFSGAKDEKRAPAPAGEGKQFKDGYSEKDVDPVSLAVPVKANDYGALGPKNRVVELAKKLAHALDDDDDGP